MGVPGHSHTRVSPNRREETRRQDRQPQTEHNNRGNCGRHTQYGGCCTVPVGSAASVLDVSHWYSSSSGGGGGGSSKTGSRRLSTATEETATCNLGGSALSLFGRLRWSWSAAAAAAAAAAAEAALQWLTTAAEAAVGVAHASWIS